MNMEKLKELVEIQGQHGNWNYDEYMYGMYNGMELMLALVEEREPVYKEKPKQWLKDKQVQSVPVPDNGGVDAPTTSTRNRKSWSAIGDQY